MSYRLYKWGREERRRNGKILVDKKMGFKKGEVRDVRERPQDYWVKLVRDAVRFASE